jgi:outer membrane lipase/esterase
MLQHKFSLIVAAALAVTLAGCGGGGGDVITPVKFTSQVVFGDSLSDVGTYAVDGVSDAGGGRYTVNSTIDGSPAPTNWTEFIAADLGLSAPCPARTGLEGSVYSATPTPHTPECTNYAQGGSRVTSALGIGNASNLLPAGIRNAQLGALTDPVVTQIQAHLTAHGSFSGTEIVFLLAGGNDAIFNALVYVGTVQQGGSAAAPAAAAAAIQAMATAGTQLAGYVNDLILANGAKYVMVLNAPDLSFTPLAAELDAVLPGTKDLIHTLMTTFNDQLSANLTSSSVVVADLFTASAQQIANPADFGLTNATTPACDLNVVTFESALFCTESTLIAGDVSRYAFADKVHPTPYGNTLIGLFVAQQLLNKGWL